MAAQRLRTQLACIDFVHSGIGGAAALGPGGILGRLHLLVSSGPGRDNPALIPHCEGRYQEYAAHLLWLFQASFRQHALRR